MRATGRQQRARRRACACAACGEEETRGEFMHRRVCSARIQLASGVGDCFVKRAALRLFPRGFLFNSNMYISGHPRASPSHPAIPTTQLSQPQQSKLPTVLPPTNHPLSSLLAISLPTPFTSQLTAHSRHHSNPSNVCTTCFFATDLPLLCSQRIFWLWPLGAGRCTASGPWILERWARHGHQRVWPVKPLTSAGTLLPTFAVT